MDLAQKRLAKHFLRAAIAVVGVSAIFALSLAIYVSAANISFFIVSGPSMEPYLKDGDAVVLKRKNEPEKNMLMFFEKPAAWNSLEEVETTNELFVKRIFALPRESVTFADGKFLINGEEIAQLRGYSCPNPVSDNAVIPADHVFVLGDNTAVSLDSAYSFCHGVEEFSVPLASSKAMGFVSAKF